jgi:large subunit ribosomal protein L15
LDQLANFEGEVTPETLKLKGLTSGTLKIKILSKGTVSKSLIVKAHAFSNAAKAAIEGAGGKVEVIK